MILMIILTGKQVSGIMKKIDLTEKRFGRLIVIEQAGQDSQRNYKWLCRCDCGNKVIVRGYDLKNGHTKSCGCLRKEITMKGSTKHGHTKNRKRTEEYMSWESMIQRCTNPNNPQWKDYGGRWIKVCKRWLGENGFIHFLEDMGEAPRGLQLDRIDNNKGYYKENCRWVTSRRNNRNKRNSRYETYKGKRWLFVELCEEHNMPYQIVYNRYYKYGWTLERALTTPVRGRK